MKNMKDRKLSVSAIKEGTVIDHIPANQLFDVISILNLDKIKTQMTFGTNLPSEKLGLKSIIKIEGKFFEPQEINRISLVAPQAKLNIIHDYNVTEKRIVEVPDTIVGIVKCVNPKCITNIEAVTTKFTVVDKQRIDLKCCYCEKVTDRQHMAALEQ